MFMTALSRGLDDSAMGRTGNAVPNHGGQRCAAAPLWITSSSRSVDVHCCPMALMDFTAPVRMLFAALMACAVPAVVAACGGAGNASCWGWL